MKSLALACLIGIVIWVIPFALAFGLYPLRVSERPLFESILPVVIAFCTVIGGALYLERRDLPARAALGLGILWLAISVALDLPFFLGILGMSPAEYVKDIAVTYLMIPAVMVGLGYTGRAARHRALGL